MRNVIEWIRVSTADQANEDRASIPAQRASNLRTCQQHGLQIVRSFEISDVSGASVLGTPEMAELLRLIKSREIHGVVAREMSRIIRPENLAHFAVLQAFVETDTVLYLPDGPMDLSSKSGMLTGMFRAAMAGFERTESLTRIWDAKEEKRKRGELAQSKVVLPYGVDYKDGLFMYKEPEASLVSEAFRRFLAGTTDYVQLSKPLGVTPRGMHLILRNPIYTGWRVIDEKRDPSAAGRYVSKNGRQSDRRKIARTADEVIRRKVISEPLISKEDFDLVQRLMDRKQQAHWRSAGDRQERFTYKNFLSCSTCLSPLESVNQRGDYYRCKSRRTNASCGSKGLRREKIEPKVDGLVANFLNDPQFLADCVLAYNTSVSEKLAARDVNAIRKRLEVLETKEERILSSFFDSEITAADKDKRLAILLAERTSLRATLVQTEIIEPADLQHLITAFSQLSDWNMWTVSQKRQVLSCLGLDIRLNANEIESVGIHPAVFSDEVSRRDMDSWLPPA